MHEKLEEINLKLPWIERLDMVNNLAEISPELSMQIEKHEQKRANQFAGNAKIPYVKPDEDPVLNDFKREMIFHRQAQSAVVDGIRKLHKLNIPTKRPDDFFAEMAKSDEHMQKIRQNLMAKQEGQAKSERIRSIREQRKMGKLLQRQSRVQKEAEKKDMLDKLKKFRKGKLENLDFLEDKKFNKGGPKKHVGSKRVARNAKFGFGGKKSGMKRNTKQSTMDTSDFKNSRKPGKANKQRPGKNRRIKTKAKGGRRK